MILARLRQRKTASQRLLPSEFSPSVSFPRVSTEISSRISKE